MNKFTALLACASGFALSAVACIAIDPETQKSDSKTNPAAQGAPHEVHSELVHKSPPEDLAILERSDGEPVAVAASPAPSDGAALH